MVGAIQFANQLLQILVKLALLRSSLATQILAILLRHQVFDLCRRRPLLSLAALPRLSKGRPSLHFGAKIPIHFGGQVTLVRRGSMHFGGDIALKGGRPMHFGRQITLQGGIGGDFQTRDWIRELLADVSPGGDHHGMRGARHHLGVGVVSVQKILQKAAILCLLLALHVRLLWVPQKLPDAIVVALLFVLDIPELLSICRARLVGGATEVIDQV